MIELRPFSALRADRGWLKAKHHFSLGGENHSARAGWGTLRVWNDDEETMSDGARPTKGEESRKSTAPPASAYGNGRATTAEPTLTL